MSRIFTKRRCIFFLFAFIVVFYFMNNIRISSQFSQITNIQNQIFEVEEKTGTIMNVFNSFVEEETSEKNELKPEIEENFNTPTVEVENIEPEKPPEPVKHEKAPNALTYKRYSKKKIYDKELFDSVEKRVYEDCKFCEFPYYPKNVKGTNGQLLTFSDAMIVDNGKKLIFMTNYNSKVMGFQLVAKLIFKDSSIDSEHLECNKPRKGGHSRTMAFDCPIPVEKKWILSHCFDLELFHSNDVEEKNKILTKPIFVRHCYAEEGAPKKKLAICAQIENRDRFNLEWIEYHRMIGVDSFYLYFHPGGFHYYDTTFDLFRDYFDQGIVHLYVWNYTIPFYSRTREHNADQVAAQNDCIYRYGDFYDWIAMIDDDEFIVPVSTDNIVDQLEKYEDQGLGGIVLNSWFYGNERRTDSHLTLEIYHKFHEKRPPYQKTIIRPKNVDFFAVHGITTGKKSFKLKDDDAYLAHYFYRKWHDYNPIVENVERDPNDPNQNTPLHRFIPKLKERLKKVEKEVGYDSYGYFYHDKWLTQKEKEDLQKRGDPIDYDEEKKIWRERKKE